MPKSSRSMKPRGSLFPSKSKKNSTLPAKQPTTVTQPQVQKPTIQKGPTMADSMKQGFGLGVGLEGARAAMGAVGGLFSGNEEPTPTQNPSQTTESEDNLTPCSFEKSIYNKCLQEQNNSLANCQDFFRMWEKCEINSQETIDEILD